MLNEAKSLTFRSVANFKILTGFHLPSLPAVRSTSARCTAPEILRNKGVIATDLRNYCSN